MTARIIPVEPFDLVVFGGTGDLTLRKLLPGLYYRDQDRQLSPESRIIGVARRRIDRETYAREVETALRRYLPLDATGVDGWAELAMSSPLSLPARKTATGSSISPPRRTCSVRSAACLRRRSW